MTKNNIQYVRLDTIKPYEKNPRVNDESIPKVAESIKQFGFLQPIVVDGNGVILAGHTRYEASKLLGLSEVPVLYAKDLSDAQAKAYRLADNKVAESSKWDSKFLLEEIDDLLTCDIDMSDFGFDMSEPARLRKSWKHTVKYCDLKRKIKSHFHGDVSYITFYETGKSGKSILEIKEDKNNVPLFADNLCDYLIRTFGGVWNDWALVTTPRRRHKLADFHFSTEICKIAAEKLGMPFYEDALTSETANRILPEFELKINPPEKNIILYDDVVATGVTIKTTRQMLIDAGHTVFCVIGIKNYTGAAK